MSRTERIAIRGIELEYDEEGSGDRPLVLVHGYTGSRDDFREQVPRLAVDGRVIAVDQRGHGGSTNSGTHEAYAIEELVADLASFFEALHIEEMDLLGHSLGGMVVLRYYLAHPERVRSLILMDTAASAPTMLPKAMRDTAAAIARSEGMGRLAEVMRAGMERPGGVPRSAAACIEGMGPEVYFGRIHRKLEQMDVMAFEALGGWLAEQESIEDRLAEITVPTLVIVGDEDGALRPGSDVLAASIAGATYDIIENAAHSPQHENADAWLRSIRRHLARVRGSR